MTEFETDQLSALITRKLTCLTRLHELGCQQLDMANSGTMTQLLDLLAVKQRVLLELQRIERDLDPFRSQDPESRRWRSQADRTRCAEELRRCEKLLSEIVKQEKQSEAALVRRREETAVKLHSAHEAGAARGAYHAATRPANSPTRLDLTSEH